VTPAAGEPEPTRRLVIASHNRAKAAEVAQILRAEGIELQVVSLADFPGVTLPPETGTTFAENAMVKAQHTARATGLPAVADDSGLEVDALGGEPGIMSARYAGEEASDEERYGRVLELLRRVPHEDRGARFRCAAAYVHPDGDSLLAEGVCEGRIASSPAGRGGFGYDPIFVPGGESRTMAQLTSGEKHAISHRGRAFRELARQMRSRGGDCAR
jgi:XTP/dITP diphosphohydrolase